MHSLITSNLGTQYRPAHDDNLVSDARLGPISGGICRASGENAGQNEAAVKAFDHNYKTKWCDPKGASEKAPAWLEYRLLPQMSEPIILGSYTLIPADDHPERDPTAWVVEGLMAIDESDSSAEDMWQILDVRSGVELRQINLLRRGQKFTVALHCPCFRWRVRITRTREAGSGVQLACWELWKAQLGRGSRCSAYLPEQVSLATKLELPQPDLVPIASYIWRASHPLGACPLNASCGDKEDWSHPVAVDDDFPAWVEVRVPEEQGPVALAAYSVRGSKAADRGEDPCWWVIEGIPVSSVSATPAHSECHSCSCPAWVLLDQKIGFSVDGPSSVHHFTIHKSLPCGRFRFRCMEAQEAGRGVKLGGIAFYTRGGATLAASPAGEETKPTAWVFANDTRIPTQLLEKGRLVGGVCRASSENTVAGETAAKVFDANPKTKWLAPAGASDERPVWIEYSLMPDCRSVTLASYTVTSANDHPERDPSTWVLEGKPHSSFEPSADTVKWVKLDEQTGVSFRKRFQKETYTILPRVDCTAFRLRITKTATAACPLVQLSSLELFAEDSTITAQELVD